MSGRVQHVVDMLIKMFVYTIMLIVSSFNMPLYINLQLSYRGMREDCHVPTMLTS